jgi:Zn-dependent protease
MQELTMVQKIAVWAIPVLFAITLHEVAHGWVARKLGDPTAEMLGRLTLNPLKHIDPIGTVLIPLLLLVLGGFIFGWAKPVPVTPQNLRNPRRDMAIVAAAGPLSNLLMAVFWVLIVKLAFALSANMPQFATPLSYMGIAGVTINLVLMVLNLIPLPPLDGGRVVNGLLPPRLSWQYSRIEPYGFFIILALLATGALSYIISPPFMLLRSLLFKMVGL